jgi:predicted lipoprotein with Yx(FWY)xxD motif
LLGSGVAFGDLDNDSDLDAFVANQESPDGKGHRVYLNDGTGQFSDTGQQLIDPSNLSQNPAIGDINGDGKLEVITGATIWLNDGQGHFTASDEKLELTDVGDAYGLSVKLADLNGDGQLDVFGVVQSEKDSRIRVYLNDGKGHFRDTGQKSGGGMIASVELGDVNGDGFVDAVTAGWRANTVLPDGSDYCPNRVWLNDGKGNFTDSGQILDEGGRHVHGVAIGDVNHDEKMDIVLGITSPPYLNIYLNDGKGQFSRGQNFGNVWVNGLALGDLNGDGNLDVFVISGDFSSGTPLPLPSEVWLNDGQGHFSDSQLRLGNSLGTDVKLGDFNGDGKLDAFVVNEAWDASCNCQRGAPAEVWLNTTP